MQKTLLPFLLGALLVSACDPGTEPTDAGIPRDGRVGADGGDGATDSGLLCVDEDSDGYGPGCALGADCDDSDSDINPAATDTCDGVDSDCDGAFDEDFVAPRCALTEGVCAGATATCGATGVVDCDAGSYGSSYESSESLCDGLDNDCDGTVDEGCACENGMTQACGTDEGVCMAGTQTCAEMVWGLCEGETTPMGEVCDGLDNDCDGESDEGELSGPACPLQAGVCTGSTRDCGGSAGWIACSGVQSYGGDYQLTETLCDGLDNNCDGNVDEGCSCIDGATQPCGSDLGVCSVGMQICTAGTWGGCAGEVAGSAEVCNGLDDDCDGGSDEDVVGLPCALTVGVCAGSTSSCGGASGFLDCVAADYGVRYEPTESACDGFDNDCDGTVDEGCLCIGGATQPCGSSTGICERGLQTCTSGDWGDCDGAIEAGAETCNGLDDDCNGSSDEGLSPMACALTEGVCADSVQNCGGATGWTACSGAESYGLRYIDDEDGAADEALCDGLDNDCDGVADEGCRSGPILQADGDLAWPHMDNQYMVYAQRFDDNFDVVFWDRRTDVRRRLTTTAVDELSPKVSGHFVAYLRGTEADGRVVVYDLRTDVQITVSSNASSRPSLSGSALVYAEFQADGQSDIMLYNLGLGTTINLTNTPSINEFTPTIRGTNLVFRSDEGGTPRTSYVNIGVTPLTLITQPTPAGAQVDPMVDYFLIGWSDARNVGPTPTVTSDWNVYGAPLDSRLGPAPFPAEYAASTAPSAQILRGVSAPVFLIDDYRNGDWNVLLSGIEGNELMITSHPSSQFHAAASGDFIVWMDNRLGSFDIFGAHVDGLAGPAEPGALLINEILADPPAGADVNGDGNASTTEDEFVEIRNRSIVAYDLAGMTLSDTGGVRHTFASGTILPAGGIIVVFGGGTVPVLLGGAQAVVALGLSLNNTGDQITLTRADGTVIDTILYGSEGNHDESLERSATDAMTRHSMVPGAIGAYSPGVGPQGFGY